MKFNSEISGKGIVSEQKLLKLYKAIKVARGIHPSEKGSKHTVSVYNSNHPDIFFERPPELAEVTFFRVKISENGIGRANLEWSVRSEDI